MNKRTILVTGGNRGIGLAIVQGLAKNTNDTILMGCRDVDQGKSEANKIGDNVIPVKLDLGSKESLAADIQQISHSHSPITVLVNNAGILNETSFSEINLAETEQSFRVNVFAPMYLVKALLPQMIEQNYGRIVNLSSGWGSFGEGLGGPFSYGISKATLNAFTLSVSRELTGNIKINSMCPGWVRTRMGGDNAARSPEQGAETALWLSNLPDDGPNGQFFRDRQQISW